MNDKFEFLNQKTPEFAGPPLYKETLDASSLPDLAGKNHCFTENFSVILRDDEKFGEAWILSTVARFESLNGEVPCIQIRLTDNQGDTLYYSPVYEIGHTREFYRREWRIPPSIDRYCNVKLTFIIPSGVKLWIREIKHKRNIFAGNNQIGIRYHGHAGFPGYAPSNTAFSFQMAAEMGFSTCITIPKFTKDGIGVCFHDDGSVRKILRYEDGSAIEEGSKDDRPIKDFTYEELMQFDAGLRKSDIYRGTRIPTLDDFFQICSMTGMCPIFSVHPGLSIPEWEKVRIMLEKYRLLDRFWIKTGSVNRQKNALEVFGTDIAGHILIQGIKSNWDPAQQAEECGFDRAKQKVVIEYFYLGATEEKIRLTKEEGFDVSIATTKGGISGPNMRDLIGMGVTEFTIDHHCSKGLDW